MLERRYLKSIWLILLSFAVLRLFAMYFVPLADPSEARYAVISQNMALKNNFVEPQFVHQGIYQTFSGKPPLHFQLGGVSTLIFGDANNFAPRFPAFFCALLMLGFIYYAVKKLRNPESALAAVTLTLCSSFFAVFTGLSMTDMTLALWVISSILSYMLFAAAPEVRSKKLWSILFFACMGLGVLTKGPVALIFAGFPLFLWTLINNRWKDLKYHAWFVGGAVFLLIVIPWFYLMQQRDPDFLEYFFVNENFKRFTVKDYGDRFGSGRDFFYGMSVVWFIVVNLPILFLLAFPIFNREKRRRLFTRATLAEPLCGIAAFGVLGIVFFWTLTYRIPIYYLLPTVPCFAIYLACKLNDLGYLTPEKLQKFPVRLLISLVMFGTIAALLIMGIVAPRQGDKLNQPMFDAIKKLQQADAKLQNVNYYFGRRTPYSAEFYLEKNIVNHDKEDINYSVEASKEAIFFLPTRELEDLKLPVNRAKIFQNNGWVVYAPENYNGTSAIPGTPGK
ncbi:MAG: glycosyltransferase family 39 protein [Victivallaceae bacterium]